jgi:hypothetical protein
MTSGDPCVDVCLNCGREHALTCAGRTIAAYRWTRGDGDVFVIDPREVETLFATVATGELSDPWCRREDCQYRNWRSGSVPTHRKGTGCPGEGVCTYTTSTADYCHTHDAYLAAPDGRCEKALGHDA